MLSIINWTAGQQTLEANPQFGADLVRPGEHAPLISIALQKIQTNWKVSSGEKATDLLNANSEARGEK